MNTARFILFALLMGCARVSGQVLYISSHDSITGSVSTHDPVTGAVLNPQFITTPGQPHGILRVGNEVLVASWGGTSRIARHDASTGALLGIFADAASQLNHPVDLRIGPDGLLWVSSQGNGRINRYDLLTGTAQTPFLVGEAHLVAPSGMTFSPDGTRFFVTDRFEGEVLEYNVATGAFVQTLADFTTEALGIQWGADAKLYIGAGGLRRLNPDAPFNPSQVAAGIYSVGVELGFDGDIYFADYTQGALHSYDPISGTDEGVFVNGPPLNGPNFFHFAIPEPVAGLLLLAAAPLACARRRQAARKSLVAE
jgi:hypothetical protein